MSFQGKKIIALIPARGGSKGVARKNLRVVSGLPLVVHSLRAALEVSFIDHVFLSSEDNDILELGKVLGVSLHKRSQEAATDVATADDVVKDFMRSLPSALVDEDPFIVYLQPTSPMRKGIDIINAFSLLESFGVDKCISVQEVITSPFKSLILDATGCVHSLFDEYLLSSNRQSLPKVYCPNGAIYIFPLSAFIQKESFPLNGSVPYIMSSSKSIDIDSEEDLLKVEALCSEN